MSKRRRNQKSGWVGITLFVIVFLFVWLRLTDQIGLDQPRDYRFRIVRVLDGDTVELTGGDRLRLAGIDTPEKGEPLYNEATQLLERLTLGRTARIEYGNRRRDGYGRLLGFLYIDSLYINREIIESGLGHLYLFKDSPLESPNIRLLLEAQRRAIDRRVGLYALPRPAENRYIVKSSSFRFHRPGCRSVAQLKEGRYRSIETRLEAYYEGLSPCRNCKP